MKFGAKTVIPNVLYCMLFIFLETLELAVAGKVTVEGTPKAVVSLRIAVPIYGFGVGPVAPDPVCALTTAKIVLISSLRVLTLVIYI